MKPKIDFQLKRCSINVPFDVVAIVFQVIVFAYIIGYNNGKLSKN